LTIVENSLEETLELVLAHDCLGHNYKCLLRNLSDVLAGVLKELCQLDYKLVVLFEEKNVVA